MRDKQRYTYWLEPEVYDKMSFYIGDTDAKKKSKFVRQAIKFYMGYLDMERSIDVLAPILSRAIKEEIEYFEMNMSEILFKLAVESAKVSKIVADSHYEYNYQYMKEVSEAAKKYVSENNGILRFEDAEFLEMGGH